jgi:hypothetical protein
VQVVQAESDQMVAAVRRANEPVEYIVYTDEGHSFARRENRLHFYAKRRNIWPIRPCSVPLQGPAAGPPSPPALAQCFRQAEI